MLSPQQDARQDKAQQGKRRNDAQDLLLTHVLISSADGVVDGVTHDDGQATVP